MEERSALTNGRFLHNLQQWSAAGGAVYSAGDGDTHYGVAVLPVGASLRQDFAVDRTRRYTLHIAVKGALSAGQATVAIVDGDGNAVVSLSLAGSDSIWTENLFSIGLATGTTYRLTLTNVSAATSITLDDVWLWFVPQSRSELATTVARKLSGLASDAELSLLASGAQTEGDYTDAIDAGLRAVGAIDEETDLVDVRALTAANLDICLDAIEREMLKRLQRHYAVMPDLRVGERDEKLSQIGAALARLVGSGSGSGGGGGGKVVIRNLRREARDYDLG